MRIFNAGLGERMRSFFPDCAVLSSSSMAAPSFVAAALGEPAPSHIRIAGRTLFVARRTDTNARRVLCGLAMTQDPQSPGLLPPDTARADLVLAVADGAPRNPLSRQRRHPLRAVADLARHLLWSRLGLAFGVLFAILVVGFVMLLAASHFSVANAAYLTALDAAGAAVSYPNYPTSEKIAAPAASRAVR